MVEDEPVQVDEQQPEVEQLLDDAISTHEEELMIWNKEQKRIMDELIEDHKSTLDTIEQKCAKQQ